MQIHWRILMVYIDTTGPLVSIMLLEFLLYIVVYEHCLDAMFHHYKNLWVSRMKFGEVNDILDKFKHILARYMI